MADFTPPLRATHHCRHYSYVLPITRDDSGPKCAAGLDPSAAPGFTLKHCCSDTTEPCPAREEYTGAEREAWEKASDECMNRMRAAIAALAGVTAFQSKTVECPNCGGELTEAQHDGKRHLVFRVCGEVPANPPFALARSSAPDESWICGSNALPWEPTHFQEMGR